MSTPILTDHELRLLEMMSLGWRHQDIAAELVMTRKGVTTSLRRVFRKLGAKNGPHAVRIACQLKILEPGRRHGDHAGFTAHVRRGEDPWACNRGCPEGERAYRAERRQNRRQTDSQQEAA